MNSYLTKGWNLIITMFVTVSSSDRSSEGSEGVEFNKRN